MSRFDSMYDKSKRAASERRDTIVAARAGEFMSAPTKRDLQASLADAVRNTAALPVEP